MVEINKHLPLFSAWTTLFLVIVIILFYLTFMSLFSLY